MSKRLLSVQAFLIVPELPSVVPRIRLGRELCGRRAASMLPLVLLRGRPANLFTSCGLVGFLGRFSHTASMRG